MRNTLSLSPRRSHIASCGTTSICWPALKTFVAPEKPSRFRKPRRSVQDSKIPDATQCFANCFNAYAKAINKTYVRTGSLFEHRFHRP